MTELDFQPVLTCVQRTIEEHRPSIEPGVLLDVALGLRCLSDADRQAAVVTMCRSLVECEMRDLVDRLVRQAAERLLDEPTIELAAFAVSLHGPVEAQALFPADY